MLDLSWTKDMKTPDEMIDRAIKNYEEDGCSVICQIAEGIQSDGDDETVKLLQMYKCASDDQKMVIDATLVHITGWSLKTLLELMGINLDENEFVPCEETVSIWIEEFKKNGTDIKEEIDEIRGTISNERLWQKGSSTEEEINAHTQNIADYSAYLEWLEEKAKEEHNNGQI